MKIYDLIKAIDYNIFLIIDTFGVASFFVGKARDFDENLIENKKVLSIKIENNNLRILIG